MTEYHNMGIGKTQVICDVCQKVIRWGYIDLEIKPPTTHICIKCAIKGLRRSKI
jgi:hypothetical protein